MKLKVDYRITELRKNLDARRDAQNPNWREDWLRGWLGDDLYDEGEKLFNKEDGPVLRNGIYWDFHYMGKWEEGE